MWGLILASPFLSQHSLLHSYCLYTLPFFTQKCHSQMEERIEVLLTGLSTVSPDEVFTHEVVPLPQTPSSRPGSMTGTRDLPPLSECLQIRWVG